MGKSIVAYNDIVFPGIGTRVTASEQYIYDESERTVKATRFKIRVQSIVVSEMAPSGGWVESQEIPQFNAGIAMQRIRQLLSKPGGSLIIDHEGFGERIEINTQGSDVRDVSWGPKPRTLVWEPVGNTATVEIVWECEFEIPVCDGTVRPRFQGVSQFNYSVSFMIDNKGYSTRYITGVIEIAMTRINRRNRLLVDSVDNYRDRIIFAKPPDYERTLEWVVSTDKRTANFTIVDKQIQSPNAYPPGVVAITASHRVGITRSNMHAIENVLTASIELAPTEHKSRAWMIFREILRQRQANSTQAAIMLKRLELVEDIFGNKVEFQAVYEFIEIPTVAAILTHSGLCKPVKLSVSADGWREWSDSMNSPLAGNGTDRGVSNLTHEWTNESIVDLCETPTSGVSVYPSPRALEAIQPGPLCNPLPSPEQSWSIFSAKFEYREKGRTTVSVQLAPNDLRPLDYTTSSTTTSMPQVSSGEKAKRYIEDKAGSQVLIFSGYAERVGYPIPKPGILEIAGRKYRPIGHGAFDTRFMGIFFCQPKYAAAWKQQYQLVEPLADFDPKDTNQGLQNGDSAFSPGGGG